MADKKATRQGYGDGVTELAREHKDVVVFDADLCGSVGTKGFAAEFPERHFEVGIAEQNMLGSAAGMAKVGLVPFVAGFATFCPGRAFEIIRNAIAYQKLNVKIIGSHGGLTSASDGGTHQAIEDLAIMRVLPNMTVLCPCDYVQAKQMIKKMYDIKGPVYMRVARTASPILTDENTEFEIGKIQTLKDGSDAVIFANGIMNAVALEAAEKLAEEGINVRLINVHSLKPFDKEGVAKAAAECGYKIVVVEDANVCCGLGEEIAYALAGEKLKLAHVAIMDRFGQSGSDADLSKEYGLDTDTIIAKVREVLC